MSSGGPTVSARAQLLLVRFAQPQRTWSWALHNGGAHVWMLECIGGRWGAWPAVEALALTSTFAHRALGEAVRRMGEALERGDLTAARAALPSLCSRDPAALDQAELGAAAIESCAENTSDSVVAPLFYYTLFGLPGALAYRAVNTLDAMLGYHGTLEHLGKAAARLDDLANLVPARATALLLWLAGGGGGDLFRVRRDARRTESPNAGYPMAMMAALLRVRLSKPDAYVLGAGHRQPCARDVARAWRLAERASWLALGLTLTAVAARTAWSAA